jgi:hypothetical protein
MSENIAHEARLQEAEEFRKKVTKRTRTKKVNQKRYYKIAKETKLVELIRTKRGVHQNYLGQIGSDKINLQDIINNPMWVEGMPPK